MRARHRGCGLGPGSLCQSQVPITGHGECQSRVPSVGGSGAGRGGPPRKDMAIR